MAKQIRKSQRRTTEEDVIKALSRLDDEVEQNEDEGEEDARKSVEPLPGSTKKANGGFSGPGGTGKKANVDVNASEDGDGVKAKKSEAEDDEEQNEDDVTDEGDEEQEEEVEEPTKKSARAAFRSNDTIRKGVEVSPFLESLTDVFGEEMDKVVKSIESSGSEQAVFNAKLQKAVSAIGNLVLDVSERLNEALGQPAIRTRKSLISKSEVADRDFERTEVQDDGQGQLSKGQVLRVLESMVLKGDLPDLVVPTYESTNTIPAEHLPAVQMELHKAFGR